MKPPSHTTTQKLLKLPSTGSARKSSKEISSKYRSLKEKFLSLEEEEEVVVVVEASVAVVEVVAASVVEIVVDAVVVAEVIEVVEVVVAAHAKVTGTVPMKNVEITTSAGEIPAICVTQRNLRELEETVVVTLVVAVAEVEVVTVVVLVVAEVVTVVAVVVLIGIEEVVEVLEAVAVAGIEVDVVVETEVAEEAVVLEVAEAVTAEAAETTDGPDHTRHFPSSTESSYQEHHAWNFHLFILYILLI